MLIFLLKFVSPILQSYNAQMSSCIFVKMNLSGEFIRLVIFKTKVLILRIDSGEPVKIDQPADRQMVTAEMSLDLEWMDCLCL